MTPRLQVRVSICLSRTRARDLPGIGPGDAYFLAADPPRPPAKAEPTTADKNVNGDAVAGQDGEQEQADDNAQPVDSRCPLEKLSVELAADTNARRRLHPQRQATTQAVPVPSDRQSRPVCHAPQSGLNFAGNDARASAGSPPVHHRFAAHLPVLLLPPRAQRRAHQ